MPKPTTTTAAESAGNGIGIQLRGVNLKTVAAIVVILFGGGGISIGAFSVATQDYVDGAIDQSMLSHEEKALPKIDEIVEVNKSQDKAIKANNKGIETLTITLGDVQLVQRQQFARDEAKRVTEDIANRQRREHEYDRLVDLNMWRLKSGKPPCSSVECP